MYWAAEQGWGTDLPWTARLVFQGLAYFANKDTGVSNASSAKVELLTGLSRRTVHSAFVAIKRSGLIGFEEATGHAIRWIFPPVPRRQTPADPAPLPLQDMQGTPAANAQTPAPDAHRTRTGTRAINQGGRARPNGSSSARPADSRDSAFTTTDGDTFLPGTGWVRRD
jgi:hypothetical protein